jgi:hypothetical protein
MSLLVISAMAAATFAAVHPSLGSEPAMANFDDTGAPASQITIAGGTLADSLGSEPMLAGYDVAQPTAPKKAAASIGLTVTLADSLGSEPMFFEVPAAVPATAGPVVERPHDEQLACACCR